MKSMRIWALLLATLVLSGCYVARIETGLPKSGTVISKPFASCWIFGLVPPPTLMAAAECPNGVAMVETQHSFLNYLVGGITFGIYTPIQIVVTCAEAGKAGYVDPANDIVVPLGASSGDVREAFGRAAERAVKSGEPVFVRLEQ